MDAGWQVRPVHVASMNHFAAAANPGQQGDCWPAPLTFLGTLFTLSAASPQGDTHHTRARPRELLPRPPPRSIKAADAKLARPERSGELVNPQASPAAALATLSARAVFLFCFVLKGLGRVPIEVSREAPPAATSRDVWRREGRPFWGPPPLVAPALCPRPRPGPRLAPQQAGRPTRCGGSAARPRAAPTFCRVFPAGPAYGNCRARSPLSPASLRAVSESSSATHPSAWISATGTSLLGTCPSSQVRAPAGAGEDLEDAEGRRVKPGRPKWRC